MNRLHDLKLNYYKKQYPSIKTSEEALQKAIDCEQEAKKNNNNSEYWFQCSYELLQFASLLEISEKNN